MISARGLTKRYGAVLAVDDLSFDVAPGAVTGFLGANGAGKSTTMRMVLGLDAPTAGSVTVAGRAYRDLPSPLHEVGALLDPRCMHPGRVARRSRGVAARRAAERARSGGNPVGPQALAGPRPRGAHRVPGLDGLAPVWPGAALHGLSGVDERVGAVAGALSLLGWAAAATAVALWQVRVRDV